MARNDMHAVIRTYTHAYGHASARAVTHVCVRTRTPGYGHARTYAYGHAHMRRDMHARNGHACTQWIRTCALDTHAHNGNARARRTRTKAYAHARARPDRRARVGTRTYVFKHPRAQKTCRRTRRHTHMCVDMHRCVRTCTDNICVLSDGFSVLRGYRL